MDVQTRRYTVVAMPCASRLKPVQVLQTILRFSTALEVTTDELLQPCGPKPVRKPSRKVLRRLEQIEALPSPQRTVLLKSTDTFLEAAAYRAAPRPKRKNPCARLAKKNTLTS